MNVEFVRELLARAAAASWADANRNETEARQQGHLYEIVAWRTRLQKSTGGSPGMDWIDTRDRKVRVLSALRALVG